MSTTDATAPAPAHAAATARDWLAIPRLAGRLLWNHWPPLLFWYFAARVAYDLLLHVAILLAETSVLLSYAAIALLIVTQLIGTIGMFLVLRPSLSNSATRRTPDTRSQQPWLNALAVALLPFFAYYAAWGLLDGIKRDFSTRYLFSVSFENRESIGDILGLQGLWLALLIAWGVRRFSRRRMAATGHGLWAIVATVCEAYWVFVGVAAIARGLVWLEAWWRERAVYVAVADWWRNPFLDLKFLDPISLAPLKRVVDPVLDVLGTAAGAVVMPLIWLAITALIYGLDLRRQQRLDAADARLRYAMRRYGGLHAVWHWLAKKASGGWTSKGVPLVNSLRLVLRAGLPALLTLCLCWQLLAFVDASAWLAVVKLVGAHGKVEWEVIGQPYALLFNGPLSMRPALFTELLRVVLLAATFTCAIRRLQRTGDRPPA